MTVEFKRLQREQYELFLKKQHDYGTLIISLLELCYKHQTKFILSLTGLWFRMNDKIQRLKNMLMSKRESNC